MHLWNPPISLWIKYCFLKARYLVNTDLNFEVASLLNIQLQAHPCPPSTPPSNPHCSLRNSKEKNNTTFWRWDLGALDVFHMLPSKLWILRHQVSSQSSANNFMLSVVQAAFFNLSKNPIAFSSNSWITAQIRPKNTSKNLRVFCVPPWCWWTQIFNKYLSICSDTIHSSGDSTTPKFQITVSSGSA